MQSSFSMPNIYADHMVFQRGRPIRLAGTAPAASKVFVTFDGATQTVVADTRGEWSAEFKPLEAGVGHSAKVENIFGAKIEINDIAIGDVWIAGGQSNMEFPVVGPKYYGLAGGEKLAQEANDAELSILHVPHATAPDGPCRDFPRGTMWKTATTPEAVGLCSAIGYLFGSMLRKRLGVPIGIVTTNWGGCRIEPWIDEATLRAHRCEAELERIAQARKLGTFTGKSLERQLAAAAWRRDEEFQGWLRKFYASNRERTAMALAEWAKPGVAATGWKRGSFEDLTGAMEPGVIWYRREVTLPEGCDPAKLRLRASFMNDTDETFWDGRKIGQTGTDTPAYWSAMRDYPIPRQSAKPGRHTLAIRLSNHFDSGGIGLVWIGEDGTDTRILLNDGEWLERVEFRPSPAIGIRPEVPSTTDDDPRMSFTLPSTLFNAMFAPLSPLRFRGAIWYQGCSNTGNAPQYRLWQKLLVESWRRTTDSPEMAFLQVQLAGFQRHSPEDRLQDDFWRALAPEETGWCVMREVQSEIRAIPLCDLVTATDIGDHSDIHPADKLEVARRLDALAGKMLYGAKGTVTGPVLKGVRRRGQALVCTFNEVGGGLVVRDRPICGAPDLKPGKDEFLPGEHAFAVASARGKWFWAAARREGDTVVVSSPEVAKPERVRYAWSGFPPSMRLFNKEGFPAFPFSGKARK